ncbi:hypothetical protein [Mesorhizobium sp. ANAO-SY3R2]|uniref:hypothetical protein n=1 Tax=Mesorhizobium sp. ANAO-SY3R2 TaxID=3166644 RepID=UPI00366D3E16
MTFETDAEFSFTDLSDRLSGKGGAEFADSALQRLAALKEQVERSIGGGLSKEDYERFSAVSEALGSAATVMTLLVKSRASAMHREF